MNENPFTTDRERELWREVCRLRQEVAILNWELRKDVESGRHEPRHVRELPAGLLDGCAA